MPRKLQDKFKDNTKEYQDYYNPKSLLTLGASSSMVVGFTTLLGSTFNLSMVFTALFLSFLFALVQVWYMSNIKELGLKFFYIFVTAMMIFSAARGGNATLASSEQFIQEKNLSFDFSLVSSAYADFSFQEETNKPPPIFKPW